MTSRDRDLDHLIDDVAREMTAPVDDIAGANLRARVIADIEKPRPFAWSPILATAGAAIAVALIVLAVTPRSTLRDRPSTLVNQTSTLRESPSTLGNPPSTLGNPPSTLGNPPSTLGNPPANRFGEEPLQESPIAVDSIAVAPMAAPPSIAVEQLPSIPPIAMTPIGTGEER